VAEGGALQAGRLWGKGLCLQLKGVTKGSCSQVILGLNSDPKREVERRKLQRAAKTALNLT